MVKNIYDRDFPGGSDSKASACNAGDPGSIPGLGRSPGEGNGNTLPVLLRGKCHGQKNLVGYSPWDRKESDMTEQLSTNAYVAMEELGAQSWLTL